MARRINFYATGEFDRAAARREDLAWIRAKLAAPSSRIYPVWRTRNFVSDPEAPRAVALDAPTHAALLDAAATVALLGLDEDVAHFLVDVSHLDEPTAAALGGHAVDLRAVGALMPQREGRAARLCPRACLLARAASLLRRLRIAHRVEGRRASAAMHQSRLHDGAVPAHRSGRHHAHYPWRQDPDGAPGGLAARHAFDPRRLRRTRRKPGGCGRTRGLRGGRPSASPASSISARSPGRFPPR